MADGVEVTKLEVGERQLRQAIRLFFSRGDEISTHTLTGAASQVLRDLAKHRRSPSPVRDALPSFIRPDKREEVLRALDKGRNYFKHADRDTDDPFTFYAELTKFLLFEAIQVHLPLTGDWFPETYVFLMWFNMSTPDVLLDGPLKVLFTHPEVQSIPTDDYPLWLMTIDWCQKNYGERFRLPLQF